MDTYLRVNSLGYLPTDQKIGLAMTNLDLTGKQFQVSTSTGSMAAGPIGKDRGPYAAFLHLYEMDFTSFNTPGIYFLQVENNQSDPFEISSQIYQPLIPLTLQFFQVQRCGSAPAEKHDQCHLSDGVIKGSPQNGRKIDTTGGWHDAGDYLKFLSTTAFSLDMMLTAYIQQPEVFQSEDQQKTPAVLQEAQIGLDWIYKMWNPTSSLLFYQVGDASDHETWRLPEADQDKPARPVWPVSEGKGANLAGKSAAAMALASVIWGDKTQPYYDRDYARKMLTSAESLYKYGKKRPAAQSSEGFYVETSWSDDMALAAAELYRATKNTVYLRDARAYAFEAGSAGGLNWSSLHGLAHYELAKLDLNSMAQSRQFLEADLMPAEKFSRENPFKTGLDQFFWGSNETLAGLALEAIWYEDLTLNQRFLPIAQNHRDYIFGVNPWGVCWVSKACLGVMPLHPHHQIADLANYNLPGFWDEGPVPMAEFEVSGIQLDNPDEFALFQDKTAVYHDDRADYMTNEPTIAMNAIGLALASWSIK